MAKEVLQQYVVVWFWHTTGAYNGTLLSGKTKEKILPEDRTCALCMEMESARKMLAGTCTVLYKLQCARARVLYKLRIYIPHAKEYTNNNKRKTDNCKPIAYNNSKDVYTTKRKV